MKKANLRKYVSAEERPVLTSHFLSTGGSQQSLHFSYRIGKVTVNKIIFETCEVIYTVLKEPYFTSPSGEEEWLYMYKQLEEVGKMPHAIGRIDGKHSRVECPKLSGTIYCKCKGFFSFLLMTICDTNCCFTLFGLEQYGSNNDSDILVNLDMGKMF